MAPPKIAAKGKDFITVKTDKKWRGKTTATTSGEVVYEIDGEKKGIVKIVWLRKGDGIVAQSDSWSTESGRYSLTGHQSEDGEFTFWFEEAAQAKAPDPKPAVDPKAEKPESGGGKESKSPPPADTFVLFKQGKFDLTSEARSRLHDFAMAYLAAKSTAKIDLDGWASIEGVEASNKTLSFDRAEAVFNYLVDKEKLSKDNIQWDGHGVTSDFDPDKKKLEPNRRVTLKVK
jgi:outer membrane protein OmpA-like peptidoglycan-associated protein